MFLNMSFFAILLDKIELNWIELKKTRLWWKKTLRSEIIQIDNGIKYIIFEKYDLIKFNWIEINYIAKKKCNQIKKIK